MFRKIGWCILGKMKYNSSADRKMQQRYQRIQARKEDFWDIETPRSERRRQKRTLYACSLLNVERLLYENIAVVCRSESELLRVYNKIHDEYPQYTRWVFSDALQYTYALYKEESAMAIVTEDSWFGSGTFIKFDSRQAFERMGFEIVYFGDLLPVRDLGRFRESSDSIDYLLGLSN